MEYKNNGESFYDYIKRSESFCELLETYYSNPDERTQASIRGYAYEKMWDLIIKFGFCPYFSNSDFEHYSGNNNTGGLKKVSDLKRYLKKLNIGSKGEGGSSDITLKSKIDDTWIFISCKFYKRELKNKLITDYGIQEIIASSKYQDYGSYKIGVCVKNKVEFDTIINCAQSTNNYIKQVDYKLDLKDLEIAYRNLRKAILPIAFDDISQHFDVEKEPLILRFHQQLVLHKQLQKIREGKKSLLLGANQGLEKHIVLVV